MRSFTKVSLLPAVLAGAVLASAAFADQEAQKPVSFALKAGVTHTDNRDSIEDGALRAGVPMKKEDQWSFFIAPVIAFHHETTDSVKFDASYAPVFRWYDNCRPGSEKSKIEHAVKADLDLMLTPITEFRSPSRSGTAARRTTSTARTTTTTRPARTASATTTTRTASAPP